MTLFLVLALNAPLVIELLLVSPRLTLGLEPVAFDGRQYERSLFATLMLSSLMAWQEREAIDLANVAVILGAFVPGAIAAIWAAKVMKTPADVARPPEGEIKTTMGI